MLGKTVDTEERVGIAERELVQALQQGGRWAVEPLLDRYGDDLMHYLLAILGNRELAEDAFQDCWRRVIEKIDRFRSGEPFGPWLFRIGRNRAYDLLRERRRWRQPARETASGGPAPEPAVRERFEERLQARDLVRRLLAELAPVYREVLWLRYFREQSYAEIAHACHLPLGTVKTRLRRALQMVGSRYEALACAFHRR